MATTTITPDPLLEAGDGVHFIQVKDCIDLLDAMGSDARVVNAARVSFDKRVDETKPISEGDEKLIHYLAEHNHDSPFFHPVIHLRIRMPICVVREWFRHVVGFARNEVSRRYVVGGVVCFVPEMIREKNPQKKQGSKDTPIENNEKCLELMKESMKNSVKTYRELLAEGTAPEIARMVLPQTMMTEFVETASLAAYARLYKLRKSPDAQYEIRQYATHLGKILKEKFPVSWAALTKDTHI